MANWNPDSRLTPAQLKTELAKTKKPASSSPASALTRAALAVLHLHGFTAWRQNNAAVFDVTKQVFRKGSAKRGISDIIGYHEATGLFAVVEVKVGRDTLSDEQKAFLAGVRAAGGFAFECRDTIDKLQKALKQWLAQQRNTKPDTQTLSG